MCVFLFYKLFCYRERKMGNYKKNLLLRDKVILIGMTFILTLFLFGLLFQEKEERNPDISTSAYAFNPTPTYKVYRPGSGDKKYEIHWKHASDYFD